MICEICETEWTLEEGHGSGGQNRKQCYICLPYGLSKDERRTLARNNRYSKNQTYKLERGCSVCGYNKCSTALEWHHTGEKNSEPERALNRSWVAYEKEISLCILLCSNCHRELHQVVLSTYAIQTRCYV